MGTSTTITSLCSDASTRPSAMRITARAPSRIRDRSSSTPPAATPLRAMMPMDTPASTANSADG